MSGSGSFPVVWGLELRAPSTKNYPPVRQTRQAGPRLWCEPRVQGFAGFDQKRVGTVCSRVGTAVLGREAGWAEGAASETRSVGMKTHPQRASPHEDAPLLSDRGVCHCPLDVPKTRVRCQTGPITTGHFRPSSRSRSPVSGTGQCQTGSWAQPSHSGPQRRGTTQFPPRHAPSALPHETPFQEPCRQSFATGPRTE
jgi:hypothetical protein